MYSIIERNIPDVASELFEKDWLPEGGKVLFQVGSCVVVESFSSCRYAYLAIDLPTGQSKQLYLRKNPLHVSQYDLIAEKILMLPFYKTTDISTVSERGQRLIERIFAVILPQHGFVIREKQLELAQMVFQAMERKQIALCEAGVGSGKTLAYLVAAIVHGLFKEKRRAFILSTSTIALQKAVTEEYLPQLSEILEAHRVIDKPLCFVVRKGKAHYACDLRLQDYKSSIDHLDNDKPLMEALEQLSWASYSAIDLSQYPLSRYVKDRICVQGLCPQSCPKLQGCRFMRYLERCLSEDYDLQIANHYYVFANVLNLKQGGRGLLPAYQAVIFDEAHKLLEAARQIYGQRLARSELEDILAELPMQRIPKHSDRKAIAEQVKTLLERNRRVFALVRTKPSADSMESDNLPAVITPVTAIVMNKLAEGIGDLMQQCCRHGDKQMHRMLLPLQERCKDLADRLRYFIENDALILWMEVEKKNLALCCVPQDLEHKLYADIWRESSSFVLTSGTLSVNGDFGLLKRDIGICRATDSRVQAACMGSPFDYANNTLLYIPERMPFPDVKSHGYTSAIAREVLQIVKATHGHTLILFSSYRAMELVYALTKDEIGAQFPLYLLKRGRVDILAKFRDSGNGVLFASDTAGEGVDLPGDILSSLIIVKLPFAVPDPISEHERKQYASLRQYQQAVVIPQMLIRLKQYVGRAIRTETDTAVISLLDSRVGGRGKYRQVVLDALFKTTVTNRIGDVRAFIRKKKDTSYFFPNSK